MNCPDCGKYLTPRDYDEECPKSLRADKKHPVVVIDAQLEYNLITFYQDLTDDDLDQAYATNSGVDWYKANLILREKKSQKGVEMSDVPRRNRLDLMSPAELAITNAKYAIEDMPADPRLTEATNLLSEARDKVADFVDDVRNWPRISDKVEGLKIEESDNTPCDIDVETICEHGRKLFECGKCLF